MLWRLMVQLTLLKLNRTRCEHHAQSHRGHPDVTGDTAFQAMRQPNDRLQINWTSMRRSSRINARGSNQYWHGCCQSKHQLHGVGADHDHWQLRLTSDVNAIAIELDSGPGGIESIRGGDVNIGYWRAMLNCWKSDSTTSQAIGRCHHQKRGGAETISLTNVMCTGESIYP